MPAPKTPKKGNREGLVLLAREHLETAQPVGTVAGPGCWLQLDYLPVSLFSLKMSSATSGVGRTLLVPTPYALKMALLDAGLRTGHFNEAGADLFVKGMAKADLRMRVPDNAVVTHTIVKIRQETKQDKSKPDAPPYTPNIAYREFVYFSGIFSVCVDLGTIDLATAEAVVNLGPRVSYIGKRGGFFQFIGAKRIGETDLRCSVPVTEMAGVPTASHIATLDDFGPGANFDAMNSFSKTSIKRGDQRKFVPTVVPLGRVFVGPGFTQYRAPSEG